jgi:hypothetical protein
MQPRCAPANLVTTAQLLSRLSTTTKHLNATHITKMRQSINNFRTLLAATIAITAIAFPTQAANLSDKDKQFLAGYEKVHTALAADDLSTAKSAAKDLGEEGSNIAQAGSLKDARAGFEKLSSRAKTLVPGQSSYHVFHCPMLKKDWVQTSTTVANPYGGKEMAGCGEIQK